ncbi:MAG: DUF3426 domain-containing protein [Porticoccaceae bacterium]|nr:DUF3426 domain-containing protein [Porticoccaceae bacterium]
MDTDTKQTRCPHCSIAFYVTNAQVLAAEGTVRCGICLSLFDANENPVVSNNNIDTKPAPDDKLQESEPALELSESQTEPLPESEATPKPEPEQEDTSDLEPEPEPNKYSEDNLPPTNPETPNPEIPNSEGEQEETVLSPQALRLQAMLPELVAEAHPEVLAEQPSPTLMPKAIIKPPGKADKPRVKRIAMFALAVIAATALLIQVLFYTSARLSLDQRYRPTLKTLCGWLSCPIAEWQNLDLIQSEALVIQKHPKIKDALQVDVVITNRAAFPQRFPGLQLQFEDLQGKVLARRTFHPDQYRTGALASLTEMTPQQAYQIRLDLVAPESTAVSYSLTITN